MRLTRSSMLQVMGSEYIKTARLKGNPERVVVWRHALRNALIPIVAMGGMQLGRLLGGAVIVETIFGWPGLGQLILEAINTRDYSVGPDRGLHYLDIFYPPQSCGGFNVRHYRSEDPL